MAEWAYSFGRSWSEMSEIWGKLFNLAIIDLRSAAAESESVDKRPACDWPVTTKSNGVETTERCKSEKDVFKVSGKGKWTGRSRESDICGKHLGDAWNKWPKVESAEKYPTKRTGE